MYNKGKAGDLVGNLIYMMLEAIRSVVYLIIGLFVLNVVQQSFLPELNHIGLMLLFLVAGLMLMVVFHRQVIADRSRRLNPILKKRLIITAVLLIISIQITNAFI